MDYSFPTAIKVPIKLMGSKDLTNYQKMVWIHLQVFCTMGCSIYSFRELAQFCGLSPKAAREAGKVLLEKGLVFRRMHAGGELCVLGGDQ